MSADDFQKAWRAQSSRTRVTIDADVLLKEVLRSQGHLQATVFWRDLREIGTALVMVPVWFYLGLTFSLPWTWYLAVPGFLWVAAFLFVDRRRHKQKPSDPGGPLLASVQESLVQVEHQIWLLRHVVWWYLLPLTIPGLAFFAQVAWRNSQNWWQFAVGFALPALFVVAIDYLIYCLNQYAVRAQLEPRRQELLALLASLENESAEERTATGGAESGAKTSIFKRLLIVVCLSVVVVSLVVFAAKLSGRRSEGEGYPRLSPFAAVRWRESQPEVKIGQEWYKLVSLDDVRATEIVAFSQRTYADKWQKRFEEDLVELLTRMGHPPRETVKLVVQPLTSSETRILDDVLMTEENRQAIKAAAEERAKSESIQE